MDVMDVQGYLTGKGYYHDAVDGIAGLKTEAAAARLLRDRSPHLPPGWSSWISPRQYNAVRQLMCKDRDIDVGAIDGLIGPQSLYAFAVWADVSKGKKENLWRDYDEGEEAAGVVDYTDADSITWPTQRQVRSQEGVYYGSVGKHQTMLQLPYSMSLAWDKSTVVNRFSCHEKVHDSLEAILLKTLEAYGLEKISKLGLDMFGGCLNVRKVRGGSRYSMHSWGIAIDLDPINNQLKWGRSRATFSQPVYDDFWKIVKDQGWIGLGPAKDYDWMHLQAARI